MPIDPTLYPVAASSPRSTAGSFTSSGASPAFLSSGRAVFVTLSGTFAATVVPELSLDGGTTWAPLTYSDGTPVSWNAALNGALPDMLPGLYRLNCTWASGTVAWRITQ